MANSFNEAEFDESEEVINICSFYDDATKLCSKDDKECSKSECPYDLYETE